MSLMVNVINPEDDAFIAEVCWQYYVNELTQAEIAKFLGVTRLRVNQAIQRAKSAGAIKVQIESSLVPCLDLQDRLRERMGLTRAFVAPAHPQSYDFHRPVGAALANYVIDHLQNGLWEKIGVSWGLTLQNTIERMPRLSCPDVEVISVIGGTSRGETFNSFGIASGFAARLGARYSLLAAPIFLSDEVKRSAFLSQKIFETHFRKFHDLDAVILTASDISPRSYLISTGLPDDMTPETLIRSGAIGDVVGRFLDINGNIVSEKIDALTIGIDLDVLRKVPERILAAAGPHKTDIIRAVIAKGLATTLITDDVTARLLLDDLDDKDAAD